MKKTIITMIALLMTMCAMGQAVWKVVKADGTVVVYPAADIEYVTAEKHDYVDLGLPSGTLWATTNVGAKAPEEYGDPFAWAETKTKDGFGWGVYKYCHNSNDITKYVDRKGYGDIIDNKTELDPEDDAAYVNWGPEWRTPSKEQFDELVDANNATVECTTLNDVDGFKITSKTNGESIFLPAAGFSGGSSSGTNGYYWSRTLCNPVYAYYLHCGQSYVASQYRYRYYGHTVRPVRNQ